MTPSHAGSAPERAYASPQNSELMETLMPLRFFFDFDLRIETISAYFCGQLEQIVGGRG